MDGKLQSLDKPEERYELTPSQRANLLNDLRAGDFNLIPYMKGAFYVMAGKNTQFYGSEIEEVNTSVGTNSNISGSNLTTEKTRMPKANIEKVVGKIRKNSVTIEDFVSTSPVPSASQACSTEKVVDYRQELRVLITNAREG